jgi:hypothetical protein
MVSRSARCRAAAAFCLLAAAGCVGQVAGTGGGRARPETAPAGAGRPSPLAADYLRIAMPANRQLDHEADGYADHAQDNLAAAAAALRAEAVTESWFDERLVRIPFPPGIGATARALVRVNERRIDLTERQARSATYASLRSFTGAHRAADAAVEAQVRIMRRELGLPPPDNS